MKLNLNGDRGSSKRKNSTEVHRGDTEALLRKRKEMVGEVQSRVEELFERYDGGGLVIVMNDYDENNEVTGARVAVFGVDEPTGLVSLSRATHEASEDIIATIQKSGDPMVMVEALLSMLHKNKLRKEPLDE